MNSEYMKFLMRYSYMIAFTAFIAVLFYAFYIEIVRDREAAKQAFQQQVLAETGRLDSDSIALDQPHRGEKELKNWITAAVSESLYIDPQTYNDTKEDVQGYYTLSGFRQYQDYLKDSAIIQSLKDNNTILRVFLEDQPLLLTSQSVGGIYRWLYQVPMTISFIPKGNSDVEDNVVNRKLTLRMQIRRVSVAYSQDEMQIESWSATARK